MNAAEMLDEIEKIFPDAHCELLHESHFQLLVAVILSAQTTDVSVNKVTPALFAAYPDAKSLAAASVEDVEGYLKSLGLFHNKAKNIVSMAQDLLSRYDGVVPSSYKDLQSLAGVGRKTANVVRSVAFDIPALAVDTHVDRVSKRLGLAEPSDNVRQVEEKLKEQLDSSRWNKAHHDLIFFGRYFCTAKKPNCAECPFTEICQRKKLDAWNQAQKEKKKMKKDESLDQLIENTTAEVEAFIEAANPIVDLERNWQEQADTIKAQAEILAKVQNAMDNGVEGKPFVPDEQFKELFMEVNAFVEGQNDLDNGFEKANPQILKHLKERDEADEWNPQTVIDEKIKEEQDEEVSQNLRNEIVQGLEG